MNYILTETTGHHLEIGDIVKVDFTDSYCAVINKSFKYGRDSIGLLYYDSITKNDMLTIIPGHKKVLKRQST